jgi:hypothetical protein
MDHFLSPPRLGPFAGSGRCAGGRPGSLVRRGGEAAGRECTLMTDGEEAPSTI